MPTYTPIVLAAPSMFCDGTQRRKRRSYPRAMQPGLVEGVAVSDIMLDTASFTVLLKNLEGLDPIACMHT